MTRRAESGFTLVEVLVAVVVLAIGILGLVGTSAVVTRMVGQGKRTTNAAQVAGRRVEALRQLAKTTTPPCTALASGSATLGGGVSEQWVVSGSGRSRTVRAIVRYPGGRGRTLTDTVTTIIFCG
ncbi:MAG TPA: prepilin-type N-terminal cleavage/methylation domain-containing protein [Gemmatimonadales bacterium]|nr:prepilin-type N-terminal cleavage/methylation domain-containing protein [Gemmatimonadales bacterium]